MFPGGNGDHDFRAADAIGADGQGHHPVLAVVGQKGSLGAHRGDFPPAVFGQFKGIEIEHGIRRMAGVEGKLPVPDVGADDHCFVIIYCPTLERWHIDELDLFDLLLCGVGGVGGAFARGRGPAHRTGPRGAGG